LAGDINNLKKLLNAAPFAIAQADQTKKTFGLFCFCNRAGRKCHATYYWPFKTKRADFAL